MDLGKVPKKDILKLENVYFYSIECCAILNHANQIKQEDKMKKILALLLCSCLLITALAACGGSTNTKTDTAAKTEAPAAEAEKPAADAEKPAEEKAPASESSSDGAVTLTWFTESMQDDDLEGFTKCVLDPIHANFPNIKINHTPTADWNQALKIQMASGSGPDIFNVDGPTVSAEYAASGMLLDLDPYLEKYGWQDVMFEWALNSCKINGKLMSLPNSYETLVTYYNKSEFDNNGWKYPTNFDELTSLANNAIEKGLMPFAFGTSNFKPANEWWFSAQLTAFLGTADYRKVLTGEMPWTDPKVEAAFQQLVDMWQNGWLNEKKSHSISTDDSISLFVQGKSAMKMSGTWEYFSYGVQFKDDMDFDWDFELLPPMSSGGASAAPLALGGSYCINKATKNPDEAAAVMDFHFRDTDNIAKKIEGYGGQPLPVEIPRDKFSDKMDSRQYKIMDLCNKAAESGNIGYCSWTFYPAETRNYLIDNLDTCFLGELTVADYLKQADELFQKEKDAGKLPIVP